MKTGPNEKNAQRVLEVAWEQDESKKPPVCNCDICRAQLDQEEEIVVVHVCQGKEHFTCDSPLHALLIAINLGAPVSITTGKMTRGEYQRIPPTDRARELTD